MVAAETVEPVRAEQDERERRRERDSGREQPAGQARGGVADPNGNGPGSVQLWNVASPARPSPLSHPLS